MKALIPLMTAAYFVGAASGPRDISRSQFDAAAEGYVKLVLAVGQHSRDFVDAYFGPPAW